MGRSSEQAQSMREGAMGSSAMPGSSLYNGVIVGIAV